MKHATMPSSARQVPASIALVPQPSSAGSGLQCRAPSALPRLEQQEPPHKLSPSWEGLYVIAEVLRPGAYKLKAIDSEVFINVWNIEQLRHFYP